MVAGAANPAGITCIDNDQPLNQVHSTEPRQASLPSVHNTPTKNYPVKKTIGTIIQRSPGTMAQEIHLATQRDVLQLVDLGKFVDVLQKQVHHKTTDAHAARMQLDTKLSAAPGGSGIQWPDNGASQENSSGISRQHYEMLSYLCPQKYNGARNEICMQYMQRWLYLYCSGRFRQE